MDFKGMLSDVKEIILLDNKQRQGVLIILIVALAIGVATKVIVKGKSNDIVDSKDVEIIEKRQNSWILKK